MWSASYHVTEETSRFILSTGSSAVSRVTMVKPHTLMRWHRQGWRFFWRWKSRPGRPPIPVDLRRLIVTMARANPTWGEERIADELLLKLGLVVSPCTGDGISGTCGRPLSTVSTRRGSFQDSVLKIGTRPGNKTLEWFRTCVRNF